MDTNRDRTPVVRAAPAWAERQMPRPGMLRGVTALLVIRLPDEESWQVVSSAEADAIADPDSFLGALLRAHCGLLALPHMSVN